MPVQKKKDNRFFLTRIPGAIIQKRVIVTRRIGRFVDTHPLSSFFILLLLFLILIILSNQIRRVPQETTKTIPIAKPVSIYRIGTAPTITVSAQTKKSGVVQITALTSGVIDKINVSQGSQVSFGATLLSMSSNYAGENSFSLLRQIAQQQFQTNKATFQIQKDLIMKQKELVEKNQDNAQELRKINAQSLDETRSLIDQNEQVLSLLDQQISDYQLANPSINFSNRSGLIALKQQQVQFTATVNQARQALRTSEYNSSNDKPPADIAQLTKEIAIKQLDVQEKQLRMSLEVSRLQSQVAAIMESLMFPSAPFAGTVQRVMVKEKQQVTVGTPLLVLSQTQQDDPVTAVAFVSLDAAQRVSRVEPSTLHIGNTVYSIVPSFVSTEAVQGTLYAIYYPIPQEFSSQVVSEGFISIDIPVGYADTTMIATYIPLDAVYQTRDNAYVFVVSGNMAKSRKITLGQVYGRFVEVTQGLLNGDSIILDRNIIEGDLIEVH